MNLFAWLKRLNNRPRMITVAVCDVFVASQYRKGQDNKPCGRAYIPSRKNLQPLYEIEPTLLPPDFDGKLNVIPRNETATRPESNFSSDVDELAS